MLFPIVITINNETERRAMLMALEYSRDSVEEVTADGSGETSPEMEKIWEWTEKVSE